MANTTWSTTDLSGITLSNANLTATTSTSSGAGVRSVLAKSSGKCYWEYTVGATFASGNASLGIANASAILSSVAPTPNNACVAYKSGNIYLNNVYTNTTIFALSPGNVIGVALDMTGLLIWFRVAPSGNWNGSGIANPATGVGGISLSGVFSGALPAFAAFADSGGLGDIATANFGDSAFAGTVPSGFAPGFPGTLVVTQSRVMVLA